MPTERLCVVDRIEGDWVVLVDEAGRPVSAERLRFSSAVQEGLVLRVPLDQTGEPQWERATVDEAETRLRIAFGEAALRRLRGRDPGGDIKL